MSRVGSNFHPGDYRSLCKAGSISARPEKRGRIWRLGLEEGHSESEWPQSWGGSVEQGAARHSIPRAEEKMPISETFCHFVSFRSIPYQKFGEILTINYEFSWACFTLITWCSVSKGLGGGCSSITNAFMYFSLARPQINYRRGNVDMKNQLFLWWLHFLTRC